METNGSDFFSKMCKDAGEELASGKQSWREIETNTLILACIGMLSHQLTEKLTKPLWFFASSTAAAAIGYLVTLILGG
ncbi:MAG: hypothetical protein Q8O55_01485 [Dehalococcoidales bacterium]|nr:hypothetical protein [Dehalococcoidales bacterium]